MIAIPYSILICCGSVSLDDVNDMNVIVIRISLHPYPSGFSIKPAKCFLLHLVVTQDS